MRVKQKIGIFEIGKPKKIGRHLISMVEGGHLRTYCWIIKALLDDSMIWFHASYIQSGH